MLWAVRPIYESEITKRVAQASDGFLKELGSAYQRFLDPLEISIVMSVEREMF